MDRDNFNDLSVLIVDDNEDNLQIAAKVVSSAGFRVILAQDGTRALAHTNEEIPDAILLDIMMPGLDGLEVCRQLKLRPELEEIPIIFLSALGDEKKIEEGLTIGGVDYVIKPFSERVLLARLILHIERGLYLKKIRENNRELAEKNRILEEMHTEIRAVNTDLETQIEKNLHIFAALGDQIRNPLSVMVTMLEMHENPEMEGIIAQIHRIDKAVDNLDKGFVDSDKVRQYLKKHYSIL
jgi:DNA-binding response OmpR family regulator